MKHIIRLLLLLSVFLAGCSTAASSPTPQPTQSNPTRTATTIPTDSPSPTSTLTPTLSPSNTLKPSPSSEPTATPSPTPTKALCTNKADFIRHLSVSENTQLPPGYYFAKVWRIRNNGTCTWTQDYAIVFNSGDDLGSPASSPLPREVKPGETVDVQVPLHTPFDPNTYTGSWLLRDHAGNLFGSGSTGMQPLSAIVVVVPLKENKRKDTLACG